MTLVPCPSCGRHVRAEEAACPFCASVLPAKLASRAVPRSPRRLERLAAFTFAATIAVTGCALTDGSDDSTDNKEQDIGAAHPMYGMPPHVDAGVKDSGKKDSGKKDAGKDAAPCDDGGTDNGGFHAMYGMPPAQLDHGGFHAMYGMPPVHLPPPCTDEQDAGGFHAMYGMPPVQPANQDPAEQVEDLGQDIGQE